MQAKIYCDGACSGNPGPGGWGACIIYSDDKIEKIYGYELATTNNKMELTAAIKALEVFQPGSIVSIYTDSKYLQLGMTQWLSNWIKKKWRTSSNTEVKNTDLWQKLLYLNNTHLIQWNWVKGHGSDYYNQVADSLACKGRDYALGKVEKSF